MDTNHTPEASAEAGAPCEIISVYSDAQAVEDGILVALSKRNRATVAVFGWLADGLAAGSPPSHWPVDLFGWIKAKNDRNARAMAAASALTQVEADRARRLWDAGDSLVFWPTVDATGQIVALTDTNPADPERLTLWIIPNEVGGVTLMFPEDY